MQISWDQKHKALLGGLIALAIAATTPPALATMQANASSNSIRSTASTPVIANDEPAPPGTGANPGDSVRAEMQAEPQPFPVPPLTYQHQAAEALPMTLAEAPVVTDEAPPPPGTGPNPGDSARAGIQAHPQPFPFVPG